MKRGLVVFSPIQVATLRISLAGVSFLPFFLWRLRDIDWSKLKYFVIISLCGSGIPALLFPLAQRHLNSSVTGVLNSLTPLFTLIWGIVIFRAPMFGRTIVGVVIGLAGAAVLILSGKNGGGSADGNSWYGLLVVLACALYGIGVNTTHTYLKTVPSSLLTSINFVLIGVPAIFILFSTDFLDKIQQAEGASTAFSYILLLSMIGTVAASLLYFRLIQQTNGLFASTVAYLMPITAVVLGMWDGEQITVFHLVGMFLILIGVYITNLKTARA